MTKPPADTNTPQTHAEDTFLATASHEIRTPLNGILGTVSLLLETDLSPSQKEYAEVIKQSGARLLDLLNNVLDYARLDANAVELEAESFCPVRLAREVVELLSPRAHGAALDIASRAYSLPMPTVTGDAGRVRQILFNLVGNALKFTLRGGVLVDIAKTDTGIRYTITDTGPGISEDARESLFVAFRQANARDAQNDGGVGLGLSIVKRLTDLLGGTLTVSGGPGLGTAFSVDLPMPTADLPPTHDLPHIGGRIGLLGLPEATSLAVSSSLIDMDAAAIILDPDTRPRKLDIDAVLLSAELPHETIRHYARRAPALVVLRPEDRGEIATFRKLGCTGWLVRPLRASSLAQQLFLTKSGTLTPEDPAEARGEGHVLIADDNPVNVLIARRALESAGFAITVAATGSEALDAADTIDPALILMDLRMPVMDGFEAMRRLRASGRDMPIIALSAEVNPDIEKRAKQAGADLVVAKPIDAETLRSLALKWVNKQDTAA